LFKSSIILMSSATPFWLSDLITKINSYNHNLNDLRDYAEIVEDKKQTKKKKYR
jgi:hypothetical protein